MLRLVPQYLVKQHHYFSVHVRSGGSGRMYVSHKITLQKTICQHCENLTKIWLTHIRPTCLLNIKLHTAAYNYKTTNLYIGLMLLSCDGFT